MPEAKFETLFKNELELLYDAEKQLVAALPKMIGAASSETLASALQNHLTETRNQVQRLDTIFERMGEEPGVRPCEAMQGMILEGEYLIARLERSPVLDAGIIGTGRKIENYEICGYQITQALANLLGQPDAGGLLEETLDEEISASENLSELAEEISSGGLEVDERRGDRDPAAGRKRTKPAKTLPASGT